jgi:hypothetical protein
LAGSVLMLISQPLATMPSQSANPALQTEIVQAPCAQAETALGAEHTLPQAPQLFTLVRRLASHPLLRFPSQLPQPGAQVIAQTPAEHVPLALFAEQTDPQAPQFWASVNRLVSQPLAAL